jgi:NAD(P)-dependent dehydrogenase (short-subunit alcohol dehydrogenase family)
MADMFDLSGRVAIVTGGSTGIGEGIAQGLAKAGADIVIAARRPEVIEEARKKIEAMGRKVIGVPTDVTQAEDIQRLIDQTMETFGKIDNNAGSTWGVNFRRGPLLEMTEQDFYGCFDLNLKSIFLSCTMVVPIMKKQGKGCIINVSSTGGLNLSPPGIGFALYGAAKAANVNLSRAMAVEFAPEVRVNVIAPGAVDTARVVAARDPERAAQQIRGIAMGRSGKPEDFGGVAVYLASDEASWTTGSIFEVHGGLQAARTPVTGNKM